MTEDQAVDAAASDPEPTEPEPRRDPAQVVAQAMLAAMLSRPELPLKRARAPGAVVHAVVPDADR